ncbi:MAG: M56 family metallopeptidase [Verrucomicrobiota bacterium]
MIAYLLTVALHAVVLSVVASAILLVVRPARYRAVIAICGLVALAILPWFSALRPLPVPHVAIQKSPAVAAPNALPVWTVVTLPMETTATASAVRKAAVPAGFAFPDPLKSAIALWAVGTVAGFILLGSAWLRQRRWVRSLDAIDDVSWEKLQATDATLPSRSLFRLTSATASPCVTGLRHPCVVLPRFLFADDAVTALGWAVRHELSHLRAGDSRWIFVLALIRCLHGWNPLVHHLVARWADAREQLCDLAAAEIPASRNGYGHFLVTMAGNIHRHSPLTVAMARRAPARRLRSRIVSLLGAKPGAEKPVGKTFVWFGCGVAICCAALVSCMKVGPDAGGEITGATTGAVLSESPVIAAPALATSDEVLWESPIGPSQPLQIKMTSKLILSATDPKLADGEAYSDRQIQRIMRKFAQARATDLLQAPDVIARSGQPTSIEVIHEVPETRRQIAARQAGSRVPFVGISLSCVAGLASESILELKQSADYRFIPGIWQPVNGSMNLKPPAGMNPDNIKTIERIIKRRLTSGMTVCSNFGEIEPGKFLTLFTTAEVIDATGRPLDHLKDGLPSANKADPLPGFRPLPKDDPVDFPQEPPVRSPLKKS